MAEILRDGAAGRVRRRLARGRRRGARVRARDDRDDRRRARPADRPLPQPAAGGDRGGRAPGAARDAVLRRRRPTLEQAAAHPAAMLLSGPAGGAVAARIVERAARARVRHGRHELRHVLPRRGRRRVRAHGRPRSVAGLPVRLPMVDIHTVSAGGGSIAWVDSGGALRVGPQSAGADPGPRLLRPRRRESRPSPTRTSCSAACPPSRRSPPTCELDVDAAREGARALGIG